mmetsp:Transcript_2316/g.3260  ORF Transcript_2316/g.3260 Transcript_2316/m.3260 type:complete len:290 (+) Transcript_2316:62-931(+)|eukprot:CAMPEP_0184873522 /NCGR_PEP_ID=MMETSP0580-20130426/41890_1 /TAXON_ID=1118495 /ORGANISM="Dactyliosolen fragilissimus" /LENGTH=289 /DNA_ID=CAMNT_0027376441 /DNA_START=749 /DNA_END=1618 /DNA_ORIENTATION=+
MKLLSATILLGSLASTTAFGLLNNNANVASNSQLNMARKPFISGNWKLNPQTKDEAVTLAADIASKITDKSPEADVALFVPYVFIESAMGATKDKLMVGAEGVCPEINGAFTGAVSTGMLDSVGVKWALAGHSERRVIFGESDEYINGQCLKLIEQGMSVMLCIGESEAEYEQDLAGAVCAVQLKKGLAGISKEDMDRVAIAYEPVWAIGTGKVATPETAQKVHSICRGILKDMYDDEVADNTRILYGGSVTPESVDDLMAQPDIDGALVGGASLDSEKFGRIINFETK